MWKWIIALVCCFGAFSAHAQIDLYLTEVIAEEPNYTSLEKRSDKQILLYEWTENKVVPNPFLFRKTMYFAPTGDKWICYKWESERPIKEMNATVAELNQSFSRKEEYTWIDLERKIAYTVTAFPNLGNFRLTAYAYTE